MIIPINNGNSIIPIYIPQPVVTNSGVLEQSNSNIESREATIGDYIILGVVIVFIIVYLICSIKLIKYFFGDENDN